MPSSRGMYLQAWIYRYANISLSNSTRRIKVSLSSYGVLKKLLLGENCDEQLFSPNIQEKEDGGYGHIVGVVFATIVIVGVLFGAWMYHRRRVTDLKSEIAQVQYTAEPASPPGKLSISYF